MSRVERYLAYLTGESAVYPERPESRVEAYLDYLCKHGGGGGGADIEEIKEAILELQAAIKDLELFKFPNTIIIGTQLVINHGQVSGFTANDYMKFPFVVDFKHLPFVIDMAFTTSNEVVAQQNIFDSKFGMAFAVKDRHFILAISTNGTNWNLGAITGNHIVQPNTTYYVKIAWDGSTYTMSYSLDSESYVLDGSVVSTNQPYPKTIIIGVGDIDSTHPEPFSGTINLNNARLTVGTEVVWSGMDAVGMQSRMDVSMSNIDEAGEEKFDELALAMGYLRDGAVYTDEQMSAIRAAIGIVTITQEEYDLLEVKNEATIYLITEGDADA